MLPPRDAYRLGRRVVRIYPKDKVTVEVMSDGGLRIVGAGLGKNEFARVEVGFEAVLYLGEGDRVVIDFEGVCDGEARDDLKAEGFGVELGAGQVFKAFEEGLAGVEAGQERTLDLHFPSDYQAGGLAGKPVTFQVKESLPSRIISNGRFQRSSESIIDRMPSRMRKYPL